MRTRWIVLLFVATLASARTAPPPAPADGELQLVVALFRHGIRSPLPKFAESARRHSGKAWPILPDWTPLDSRKTWGDLTLHGFRVARAIGRDYARYYCGTGCENGYKVYLWADVDARTQDTAAALRDGFMDKGVRRENIAVGVSSSKVDPLYHPFKAGCGTPAPAAIDAAVSEIDALRKQSMVKYAQTFQRLYGVLGCFGNGCVKLEEVTDSVVACRKGVANVCKQAPADGCESPVSWCGRRANDATIYAGRFPYASSATEAFLLEYADAMPRAKVAWEKLEPGELQSLMELHERYFALSEQHPYLARMGGSNLVREILDQLNRKAGRNEPVDGMCPRADAGSQFVGLVGHDTNIAGIGELLGLEWEFGPNLPPDTRNLPDNDALPAGALVFELRKRGTDYFVHVEYVTQSLEQMRRVGARPVDPLQRLEVTCTGANHARVKPCELSLDTFNDRVADAIGVPNPFLSSCSTDGKNQQVCR